MSDNDQEDAPLTNWFDSESDFPEMSSVNTTPHLGVNVSPPSVNNPHDWALENEDNSAMDSAPNKGNSAGKVLLEEAGPNKRGDLLDTPIHTPPQSKSPSPFSCHSTWGMGRGRGMRQERKKKFIMVSEGRICFQSVGIDSPFSPQAFC